MNHQSRPVNLDLFTIKFPVTAISSILHRASGVIIFLLLPFALYLLQFSLSSQYNFATVSHIVTNPWVSFFLWVLLSGFIYHLIAGVRHLLMDHGLGESRQGGRIGAWIVIVLSFALIIALGVWLLWG